MAAATTVFPFCEKRGVYFADAEIVVTAARRRTSIRGTSLGFGRRLSALRCRSELMERWAHLEWELDGRPLLSGRGMAGDTEYSGLAQPGTGDTCAHIDGSGYCAGPEERTNEVLAHGLREVIERDSVVRVFDRAEFPLYRSIADVPESMDCLLRGQKATAETWTVRRPELPPTVIALVSSSRRDAAAVGTSCQYSERNAVTRAVLEGVMMLTTVRHTRRAHHRPREMHGILWAADHGTLLRGELQSLTTRGAPQHRPPQAGPPPHDLPSLVAAVRATFTDEPVAVAFPLRRSRVSNIRAWRVVVPGALSPALARRDPWPIG
ncbi:YcaO-like family protein [Embleya sp. NPDC056575]|uniref:YcaO-like family protein n=1 Tax=unclassified Embleya TaxID=2699296 RepID=UPI0036ADAE5A